MPLFPFHGIVRATLLVLLQLGLVHCPMIATALRAETGPASQPAATADTEAAPRPRLKVLYDTSGLPAPVIQMREQISAAARSGRIEDLRIAIEWNELRPSFGETTSNDPIDFLKNLSGDGRGLHILAILTEILDAGYVAQPLGADVENNLVYIWPYFAEMRLADLTPAQEVELLRLVAPTDLARMKAKDRYSGWRLSIGADGTWHEFVNGE